METATALELSPLPTEGLHPPESGITGASGPRAIQIAGELDEALLGRLTPEILRLRAESSEPITLLVDSAGGDPFVVEALLGLLQAENGTGPAELRTLVTGHAASAAARLVVLGDHAAAFPHARIFFHGHRGRAAEPVDAAGAREMSRDLAGADRRAADRLARRMHPRLFRLYLDIEGDVVAARRAKVETLEDLAALEVEGGLDVAAFAVAIAARVGPPFDRMVVRCARRLARGEETAARVRDERFLRRVERMARAGRRGRAGRSEEEWERLVRELGVLQAISCRAIGRHEEWRPTRQDPAALEREVERVLVALDGYLHVEEPFHLLMRYLERFEGAPESEESDSSVWIDCIEPFGRSTDLLSGLALEIARELLSDEYAVSPIDAWWLGLIDEVVD